MAHQCLGYSRIYAVHGHVVAVVGRPAQRQFRHVSGSDDHTARAVGNIHQDLGTLSGLSVLISHVMIVYVLPDIPEMHSHRLSDIHLTECCPQRLRQFAGIVISSVRGAEARHGHRRDLFSLQSQHIKSPHRHQKRQRRIQPAGDADHRRLTAGMLISFLKPVRLDRKNLLTALLTLLLIGRYKRLSAERARKRCLLLFHMNRKNQILFRPLRHKSGHPSPLVPQPVNIKLRINIFRCKTLRLRQNRTVLRNHIVSAEHQILGRFSFARGGIDVSRNLSGTG